MTKAIKYLLFLCLAFLIFTFILFFIYTFPVDTSFPKVGAPFPRLAAPDLSGREVDLGSYIGRRVVAVVFWNSFSLKCREVLNYLEELRRLYGPRGLEVVGVNLDETDEGRVYYCVTHGKISYPVLIGKKSSYLRRFQLLSVPTVFLVDRQGILRKIQVDFDRSAQKNLAKKVRELCL